MSYCNILWKMLISSIKSKFKTNKQKKPNTHVHGSLCPGMDFNDFSFLQWLSASKHFKYCLFFISFNFIIGKFIQERQKKTTKQTKNLSDF